MYQSVILCLGFALVLCSVGIVQSVITDCGSKIGSIVSVNVTDCSSEASRCILKRLTKATIAISFKLDQDVNQIQADVVGVVFGLPIPFPLEQPNACSNSGLTCPLSKSNGPFHYSATFDILKSYPKLNVDVQWKLKDEKGQVIICALIPSKIM